MKAYFSKLPQVSPVGHWKSRIVFEFQEPFVFHIDDRQFEIPKGFQSDGASVPHVPILWCLFGDKAEIAAYCHDYLYRIDSGVDKDYADSAFLALMYFTNDPESDFEKENIYYFAVHEFGDSSYHQMMIDAKLH